jgi:hypothetical protein
VDGIPTIIGGSQTLLNSSGRCGSVCWRDDNSRNQVLNVSGNSSDGWQTWTGPGFTLVFAVSTLGLTAKEMKDLRVKMENAVLECLPPGAEVEAYW